MLVSRGRGQLEGSMAYSSWADGEAQHRLAINLQMEQRSEIALAGGCLIHLLRKTSESLQLSEKMLCLPASKLSSHFSFYSCTTEVKVYLCLDTNVTQLGLRKGHGGFNLVRS